MAAARGRAAAAAERLRRLVARSQAPDEATASFVAPGEVDAVRASLAAARGALEATEAHDRALAVADAELRMDPLPRTALASAHGRAGAELADVAALAVRIDAAWRAHLAPAAVGNKVQALLDAAKADPTRLLGHQATTRIFATRAGKTRQQIEAAIAQAVHEQHHPPLRHWLELLQMTVNSAKGGNLRVKRLTSVSPGGGPPIEVHLSVYIDHTAPPAAGVNASAAAAIDAILPVAGRLGAHVTVEQFGAKNPAKNPHYYRGAGAAERRAYADDATWGEVEKAMIARMTSTIDELTVRVQRFLERKGRAIGDD